VTKSNSNSLTIVATNNAYTGPTRVSGGTLAISALANAGQDSSIGRASASPTNLVLMNATVRYEGLSAQTDRGATLEGTGARVEIVNAAENVAINGRLEGPGSLTKLGEGTLTLGAANGYMGGTVISNGVLAMGSNSGNSSGAESGVGPTNSPVTFYGGTLELFGYDGSTGNNYNAFRNPLIVPEGQAGTLRLFPRGPANAGANSGLHSSLTGGGTLNLVVNYVRDNLSGDWSAFTGLINAISKSGVSDEMRINNNFGYANASVFLNDFVVLTRADTHNTTVDIGQLGGTSLSRIGAGNGTGTNTTWRIGARNTSSTFEGSISDDSAITKVGTGTLILNNVNSHSGPTTISNGVLTLTLGPAGEGSLDYTSLITIAAPGSLNVSGRLDGALNLGQNVPQTIQGNGTLTGNLTLGFLSTVAPGLSIGTLTVSGSVDMQFGSTAVMEINRGLTPNADKLVAQTINMAGTTIVITNRGGNLQAGDTFDLFDGPITDGGVTVLGPPGTSFDTSQLAVNGTVRVTSAPVPPQITGITPEAGTNIVVRGIGGISFGTYHVLTSTNVAAPLATWVPVATNLFEFDGTFSFTNIINRELGREFFLIQQQ
jgi:fibronectin-binding autotransporter adhesin